MTCRLRIGCSTTELRRLFQSLTDFLYPILYPIRLWASACQRFQSKLVSHQLLAIETEAVPDAKAETVTLGSIGAGSTWT